MALVPAGIPSNPERLAVTRLQEWKRLHDKRAGREAEDAKVDEYRKLLYRATKEGESPATWSDYGESGKQFWRDQYHNARKFFEES